MQKTILGRTGLSVTVAGLGCGGHSRIGIGDHGRDHAASIVRAAFDMGVNFFDTAAVYGTEGALGDGLAGIPRDAYVLSTKFTYKTAQGGIVTPEALLASLENSLRELRTDHVDIFHIHGLTAADYPRVRETLYPTLKKAQAQGKLRFIGATELFGTDTAHAMMQTALPDDPFDVVMIGYNLLNPSAAARVFPVTREKNVGVLCMFAVRDALSNPAQLKLDIERILKNNQAGPGLTASENALDFLTKPGVAQTVMEAAYRFCRHTPGVDVTLTGTGNRFHLEENLRAIQMPRLPDATLAQLQELFGRVDCVSGQ